MKKMLTALFLALSFTGVAHAASCPAGQFADSASVCWATQAQADAASASYASTNELTGTQQAAQPSALTSAQAQAVAQQTQASGGTSFVALAPIPGLTDQGTTGVVNATSLANFFNNLYKYLIGLAATLAVIQIIWAGLDIAFWHKDAVSAIVEDKGKIYNAIFGLVLVLSPVLVFSIINPSILNLSLNLPELKTAPAPLQTTVTTQPVCTNGNRTNCVQPTATQENASSACTPGLYCYARSGGGTNDFVCAAALADCTYLFKQQQSGGYDGILPTSSCSLCPS